MNQQDATSYPSTRPRSVVLEILALLVLLQTLAAIDAHAADGGRWTALGPAGGHVHAMYASPSRPGTIYAGMSRGGVFRSTDDGISWQPFSQGLTVTTVYGFDEGPDGTLFAATHTGVYRRARGAAAWQEANDGMPTPFRHTVEVLADPSVPGRVYASVVRGLAAGPVLFASEDGGDSWQIDHRAFSAESLALLATTPRTLVAGGYYGVQISRPDTDDWPIFASGLPKFPAVRDLVAHPADPAVLYAVVYDLFEQQTFPYKSEDGGHTWRLLDAGLPDIWFTASKLAIDPRDPDTVFLGSSDGLYRSDDGGPWAPVHAAPADVATAGLASLRSGTLLTGSPSVDGVLRSGDDGSSWQVVVGGLQGLDVISVSPDPRQVDHVAASSTRSLLISDDDGLSWQTPAGGDFAGTLLRSPADPSHLLAYGGSGIRRSLDGGASWQSHGPLFEDAVLSLHWDPAGGTLYRTGDGAVWTSVDGGLGWTALGGPLCNGPLFLAPPRTDGSLVAGCTGTTTLDDASAGGSSQGAKGWPTFSASLLHSADGGATWTIARGDLGGNFSGEWHFSRNGRSGTLLASLTQPGTGQLFRSGDGGITWKENLALRTVQVDSLAGDPAVPDRILAGTSDQGVLESRDDGVTWQPLNDGLTSGRVTSLAFDDREPARIWAGTGSGVQVYGKAPVCVTAGTVLCLLQRFRVEVSWTDFEGASGHGIAVPVTTNTGGFWFFGEGNLEFALKILDGRPINGHFWLFYGGLSTVRYTLFVTDLATGTVRVVDNTAGSLIGGADTSAFPDPGSGEPGTHPTPAARAPESAEALGVSKGVAMDVANGAPEPLRLQDDRFELEVRWRTPDGASGTAGSRKLASDTGAFYFFDDDNLEVFAKILDGRSINGRFWLFFTGLSDVGYELEVTDTTTGASRTYANEQGQFGGLADTELF